PHGRFQFVPVDPFTGEHVHQQQAVGVTERQHVRGRTPVVGGDLAIHHQRTVQTTALPLAQYCRGQVHDVEAVFTVGGHTETEEHTRGGHGFGDVVAHRPGQRCGQGRVRDLGHGTASRDRAEVLLHPCQDVLRFQVGDDREYAVVGAVVELVEGLDVVQVGGVQVGHRPDGGVMVGVPLGV